jgi:hypothetical protein
MRLKTMARNVAGRSQLVVRDVCNEKGSNLLKIAARVLASLNHTTTSCVQLARPSPVTMYRPIRRPRLVPLKTKTWKMIAIPIQAGR